MSSNDKLSAFKDIFFKLGLPFSIFNVITNTLCLIVFMQKKFRSTSTGFYLPCLAVADLAQTYLILGYYVQEFDILIATVSNFFCKLQNFLGSTLPLLPSWVLVVIAVDRFISVSFVQYSSILNKRSTKISVITCLVLIVCLINSVQFYLYRLVTVNNSSATVCTVPKEYMAITAQFKMYICVMMTTGLPFFIMTGANVLTTCKLMRSKKQVLAKNKNGMKKEMKFGATMIALNVLFSVFNTPVCTLFVLIKYSFVSSDSYSFAFFALGFFRYAHSCLQFFLYLSVNRIFRSEFIRLVGIVFRMKSIKFLSLTNSSSNSTSQARFHPF